MYYQVHDWQSAAPPDASKQCLFDFGSVWVERVVTRDLEDAGYTVTGQQQSFSLAVKGGKISGHMDGWISGPGLDGRLPLEIKGYTYAAERIRHWRDFLAQPQPWLQQVPCQMQIYLLQAESEAGVFCLFDKKGAQMYPIPITLDYEFTEGLLKRAELVYEYLAAEIEPDRIPYDDRICNDCDFAAICQPLRDVEVSGGLLLDEAMEQAADTYFATEEAMKKHTEAARRIRSYAKGLWEEGKGEHFILGPAQISVTTSVQKRKAQEARETEVTRVDIRCKEEFSDG